MAPLQQPRPGLTPDLLGPLGVGQYGAGAASEWVVGDEWTQQKETTGNVQGKGLQPRWGEEDTLRFSRR